MTHITLQRLKSAIAVDDPNLPQLVIQLSFQTEIVDKPRRQEAPTFDKFLNEISTREFSKKTPDEQMLFRQEKIAALESDSAEIPLSDQLRLHEVLLELWARNDAYSRHCLLKIIPEINLIYGPWRGLKKIFKDAEAQDDWEIYSALSARLDMALATGSHRIKKATMQYLTRRAWRSLRRVGESFPALYADKACEVLAHYSDDTRWPETWVANHIFYHETGNYSRQQFTFRSRPSTLQKYRAFSEHWRRSPRPLFALLETAQSEQVRRFASTTLKSDFRASLRDIEAAWVARLVNAQSDIIDEFTVWIFENVPKFEQDNFKSLGLHVPTLKLLESSSPKAREYAVKYARIHARDLEFQTLIKYVRSEYHDVSAFALDIIQSRHPKKDIGLEAWGNLLDINNSYRVAEANLREHFSSRDLTLEWFKDRLLKPNRLSFKFACKNLGQLHTIKKIGTEFFCSLIEQADYDNSNTDTLVEWALSQLEHFDLNSLDTEFLKIALIHPYTYYQVFDWVDSGSLDTKVYDIDLLKALAFQPSWEKDSWIAELKKERKWAKDLVFDEDFAYTILQWLADIRRFTPEQLSFEWLMTLMQRSESLYHDFAVDVINRSFLPADFAEGGNEQTQNNEDTVIEDKDIAVDLSGNSFMFTGKLSKMTRGEAQSKVTAAGGANSSGVTKKLNYLVIGDEGSPLYGEGRKGSKQLKAEKLIEEGADLKVISETAFLQMLAGETREFSDDAIEAGCQTLWNMLIEAPREDAPLALFAIKYIRCHHPDICLAETDRPVDPGAEIPESFLNFERVSQLFKSKYTSYRKFALELARWEFARWSPSIQGIVAMAESPYDDVRQFVCKALTVDENPEHKRYRLSHDLLTADAVYSFCESKDEGARKLGMLLIEKNPRLQLPSELFRLTESPDRKVRAFVVKRFWSWYRDKGTSNTWTLSNATSKEQRQDNQDKSKTSREKSIDKTPPKEMPAEMADLEQFLRRVLFEVPPGRLQKSKANDGEIKIKLRALPTRKSKLNLIETLRDIAIDDISFAEYVLPLLQEFKASKGKSESAACLVAITRLRHAHPKLSQAL